MSNGSMLRGILLAISVAILGPSAFGAGGAAAKKEAAKQVVDGKINTGVATIATVEEVFLALQTFQTSVREHLIAAEASFRAVRASAISTLADAGITNTEDYPKDLLVRGGGASDQIESDVAKEVEKEARKRARAAAERFESELDIAVGIDLRSPATFLTPPAELMGGTYFLSVPLGVDVTVVASQLDVEGDGIAYFGGSGDALDGALSFKIAHANASLWISSAVLPDDNDRWTYSRSDLDEGDSMFAVSHAGKLAGSTRVSISIR